jgi:hypothetical protein
MTFAIDHRTIKIGLPVRSAVLKNCAGTLVVGWVTTSESVLLIVFDFFYLTESWISTASVRLLGYWNFLESLIGIFVVVPP